MKNIICISLVLILSSTTLLSYQQKVVTPSGKVEGTWKKLNTGEMRFYDRSGKWVMTLKETKTEYRYYTPAGKLIKVIKK